MKSAVYTAATDNTRGDQTRRSPLQSTSFGSFLRGATDFQSSYRRVTAIRIMCRFYSELDTANCSRVSFLFLTPFSLWLHAAILDFFRPFMQDAQRGERHLRTFSSKAVTPNMVCNASSTQLKRLISNYRRKHSSSRYSILWHTALIYVANAVLDDSENPDWYPDLLACLYGYEGLGRTWRVTACIAKSLLSLAMRKGKLSGRAAQLILDDLHNKGLERVPDGVRATFMADLDLAISDPQSATVEQLAHQFDDHIILKDYTTVLDSSDMEDGEEEDEDEDASMPST